MKDISKLLILLYVFVAGHNAWASDGLSACGDNTVRYTVSTNAKTPRPSSVASQAQVVIITSVRELCDDCTELTTRAAIDGSWIGANTGNSYFVAGLAPGEHQLCADWQRPVMASHRTVSFRAQAGMTYYFLVRIARKSKKIETAGPSNERFTVEQIPEGKGRLLLADVEVSAATIYH